MTAAVVERFFRAIGQRDFDAIAGCFAEDAVLRAVVPSGVREDVGGDEIAARYKRWLGEEGEFAVVATDARTFGGLTRLGYTVEHVDPEDGPMTFEQTAYVEIDADRFAAVRLACSGDRPLG